MNEIGVSDPETAALYRRGGGKTVEAIEYSDGANLEFAPDLLRNQRRRSPEDVRTGGQPRHQWGPAGRPVKAGLTAGPAGRSGRVCGAEERGEEGRGVPEARGEASERISAPREQRPQK